MLVWFHKNMKPSKSVWVFKKIVGNHIWYKYTYTYIYILEIDNEYIYVSKLNSNVFLKPLCKLFSLDSWIINVRWKKNYVIYYRLWDLSNYLKLKCQICKVLFYHGKKMLCEIYIHIYILFDCLVNFNVFVNFDVYELKKILFKSISRKIISLLY